MPTLRIFESEKQAEIAKQCLEEAGFSGDRIAIITPEAKDYFAAVDAAVANRTMPRNCRHASVHALERGRSLVTISPPFGEELNALDILEENGAIELDQLPTYQRPYNPAPLSSALGIPVLSKSRSATQLSNKPFTFPSWLGLGLLSSKAAPFSDLIGKKTLKEEKRDWHQSFGMSLLAKSSKPSFKMKALSNSNKDTSFGFPLISNNPTPFSSMFGMPTLSERDKRR